ncbi:hypothetical protein L6R53_13240 [Myxococcota bacterium]|nr:hypothetical protein [Myxococcota bacterium]
MPVLALSMLAGLSAQAAPAEEADARGPAEEGVALRGGGGLQDGSVPAFRAASRDRLAGWAQVAWTPDPLLTAWIHGGVARDRAPTGTVWTGPTALTLGSRLRPLAGARAGAAAGEPAAVDLALSWWAGVPLAADRGAVDSDETDISFAVEAGRALGALRLDGSLGLAILGNPLRLANQDDQPLAGLLLTWAGAPAGPRPWELHARAGGSLRTPRNPARTEAALGLELRCPLQAGLEAAAGLSPAAPDLGLDAWVGWGTACRHRTRD